MYHTVSYAFRSDDVSIMTVDSVGWQNVSHPKYRCLSSARPDCGHVVFQYTLSGRGYLDIGGRTFALPKGHALMVKVSEEHCYYYREGSAEPWEFVWINIRGDEANRIWDLILEKEGHVIRRAPDSPLIQELWDIIRLIDQEKVTDRYRLSVQAYRWLLTLMQSSRDAEKDIGALSVTTIEKCKRFIREHYASPLTLDLLAEHCGINKHYLCRLFQRSEQTTPLAYLKDRRIEAALTMLRTTELPVSRIGQKCGFESPSYFGKVFRQYMSMSPTEYRLNKLEYPYDAIYYE
ncbi:AraC family transcriptional regulator [Saccharibacillus alkalitolerans]|uniref:AraC family transcriptional regulator n=1 Tax=Saccharibacillus alkalitolerans TaxID=2705290 RepID=A0ABX0F488_9BACL|nr:AraC family transcriptional regulator [Saccharibacillus alkalitolerans]NGZ74685.1 AraC family transcriptional regulator [Saccharibacillus alkalitolerans]